ncbi:phage portal protein [Ruminococcaceae bacterium OttesenSCG-928-I18]|nr:phage portal protein [Ruminococcaceae bacterium OttesenSCG-928-I18]
MLTYQDYQAASDKTAFIVNAVEEYKSSKMFLDAMRAQAYDRRDNTSVVNRMTFLEKYGIKDSKIKFFRMRNGFFPKMVRQQAQYLLGNGVTLPDEVKTRLGNKFDRDLQRAGQQALVDGINWGFWNVNRLLVFRATEFCPLFDERTSDLTMGIRFWQISDDKPVYYEVYELDGIATYMQEDSSLVTLEEKTAYLNRVRVDDIDERVTDTQNYSRIPIFPLYANDLHVSELNVGLKEDIDAYDFISSDLVDGIHQVEGIYWVVKNYGGEDLAALLKELQALKISYHDGAADADARAEALEVPHQAKQIALDLLEKKMYGENMALDTKALTGGSLTNVAIKVAFTDFDLKTDLFEYQCVDFVQNILDLLGIQTEEPKFKRRTITNDTETVDNISKMLTDDYVDTEWAVMHNPLVDDDEQDDLLKRLALEDQAAADEISPLGEQPQEEEDIEDGQSA